MRLSPLRVLESASAAERLDAARGFVRAAAPGTELLIVGASRGAADDLARERAAEIGATFGLHRFSLTQLAARLGAPVIAAAGLSPSTGLGAEAVAARATFDAVQAGALHYFKPVAATPGFARALARTLGELRQAGVATSALRGLDQAGPDLSDLLDRFEHQFQMARSADRATLFAAATEALGGTGAAFGRISILLLDVAVESASERQFVTRLISSAPSVLVTLPEGDEATRAWLDRLGPSRINRRDPDSPTGPSALGRLRTFLFKGERPPPGALDDSVRFFSAPGEGRESVEIVRAVLAEAHGGTRFDRMAIVVRSPQNYLGLLEHALARARVPAYFEPGTRRPDPSGRAFLALMSCAVEGLSAKRFAEYLSLGQVPELDPLGGPPTDRAVWVAPKDEALGQLELFDHSATDYGLQTSGPPESHSPEPLQPAARSLEPRAHSLEPVASPKPLQPVARSLEPDHPSIEGTLRTPWKWEHLLVEAAVVGGKDRWVRRLDGLAAEYQVKLSEIQNEEPESPRARAIERDLRNLDHLRRFALPIIDEIGLWPATARWSEWLERFDRLVPMVLRYPTRVLRVLAELQPMAEIGPIALDEVRGVLTERLSMLHDEPPSRRYGRVFVATPHQMRGRSFDVVFVAGLAERVFPHKPREDPMLLDHLRERLGAGLKMQHDRDRHERLQLTIAIGAAERRVYLSYPRLELAESRPRVPSFYALDVIRAITGRVPNFEELQRDAEREITASLAWPAPRDWATAIDSFEHDLARLRPLLLARDGPAVKGQAHYLLKLNECLRRSVIARWARWRPQWSQADGLMRVTDGTREALAANRMEARPYSLSALQHYASCPYRFLLSAIYRLEARDEPEPIQRMDALTRGSLFHKAQAEFFRALERERRLPVTRAGLGAALTTVDSTVTRVAAEYHERLAPAIERVWQDEIASIRNDLRAWVEHLATDTGGWEPWMFEYAFGLPGDPERDARSRADPVKVGDRFTLRGSIDLVERQRGGDLVRVTDHKTGKARTKAGVVIDGGRALQPVLYSLAVEAATGLKVAEGRLFYCTSAGGFTDRRITLDAAARRLGVEALEVIDRAVEHGQLAAAPDRGACAWCDFRPVCGPSEELRISRKVQKPLADLVELRSRP